MIDNETRERRLRELRRVVAAAPEDRFHMARFCDTAAKCGTAYCAAGWAVLDPWFQQFTPILEIFRIDNGVVAPEFNSRMAFYRLSDLFGIDEYDSDNLFGSHLIYSDLDPHAVNKADVIENIDRLIDGEDTVPYDVYDF